MGKTGFQDVEALIESLSLSAEFRGGVPLKAGKCPV